MWSNPIGPYCTWKSLRWLRLRHLETAERGLPGKHGPSKCTVEYTHGIPTGSLKWALASHQISRNHWLKGLAPDAPPHLASGVLEDSTGFARSGNSLENLCVKNAASRLWTGPLIPLFHQGSSSVGSEPEPSFKPVLCFSTPKAPALNQEKWFVSSTKTLLG